MWEQRGRTEAFVYVEFEYLRNPMYLHSSGDFLGMAFYLKLMGSGSVEENVEKMSKFLKSHQ